MMQLDAVKKSLVDIILFVTRKFENAFKWSARVIVQNDDGTLEIVPDNEYWPGMSKVPIRYGIPGITVKIKPDARVIFTFVGDNSTQPVVTSWENAAVEKVEIDAAIVDLRPGKGRSIACNGDAVVIGSQIVGTYCKLSSTPDGLTPLTVASLATPIFIRWLHPISQLPVPLVGQVVAVSPNRS